MALKVEFQQPDFSTPGNSPKVDDKGTEAEPEPREHTNGAGSRAGDGHVLPTVNDPARTRQSDSTSLDEIETRKKSDDGGARGDTNEPTLTFTDTIKHATHNAKRKLYLHHRNQRRLSKQFTAGSAFQHLPWTKHGKAKPHDDAEAQAEHGSEESLSFLQNVKIMVTTFPYWNMAFWSGWCYSIGSAMFVVDGAWAWVPQQWPDSEFKGQEEYGVPLLFLFGACLYQVGGVMAYLEAVNDGSFAGAAMKHLFEGHQEIEKEFLDAKLHTFFGHVVPHHHRDDNEDEKKYGKTNHNDDCHWDSLQKKNTNPEEVYAEAKELVQRRGGFDQGAAKTRDEGEVREYLTWRWWPSWHNLKTYHIFELGYLACAIQLLGVTLYGVTSIVILPGIFDKLVWWQELWAYWLPQVVASCCFLIASVMFTIMAQDKWHKPRADAVSWWIGTWAIIGSVGFL